MPVSFLFPGLLGGLLLVALPLVIHLISRRRARRVPFAAMSLLMQSQRRSARNLRLRQVVLLLIRTLLFLMVFLAIARPIWQEEPQGAIGQKPDVIVIVLDESASMQARYDGRSVFDRARTKVERMIRSLPDDVPIAFIACADDVHDVIPTPSFDRAGLVRLLAARSATYQSSDLRACLSRAGEIAQRVEGEGERRVWVISDLARHAVSSAILVPRIERLVVEWQAAYDGEPPPNHGLSSLSMKGVRVGGASAVELGFQVHQYGGVPHDVAADLRVDGTRRARLSLPLSPGGTLKRAFTYSLANEPRAGESMASAVISLDDDAYSLDNQVEVPVQLPAPLQVLIVDGEPQPVPFRDEVYYLENALAQAKADLARLDIRVIGAEQLNENALASARVVVLANVARIDDAAASALQRFVEAGGGVLITSGKMLDIAWYNAHLASILPGRLRGTKGQALLDDARIADTLGMQMFSATHPIFRDLVVDDEVVLPGLQRVETHSLLLVEPDAGGGRDILMRFSNEAPALLERRVGAGSAILLATTVDRDWTDLPIRPGFLPLIQQTVLYLAGALERVGPRFVRVGDPQEFNMPRGADRLEVRGPQGQVFPLQGAEDAKDSARDGTLRFSSSDLPGLYQVWVGYPGGELKERSAERFSVTVDPRESDLTRASEDELRAAAPEGAVVRGGGQDPDEPALWPWLLLCAVGLYLAEAYWVRRN